MPRLLTYNVHSCLGQDGQRSLSRIADVIASCEPDIVTLQELDAGRVRSGRHHQAEMIAAALGMALHFHPAVKVMEELYGDAILTTQPCRLVKTGALIGKRWFPAAEPRGALWTAIDIDGATVQVINTHLGVTRQERVEQTATLLGPDWLSHPDCRGPVILTGDFNALPNGRTSRRLHAALGGQHSGMMGNFATFPSRLPVLSIDHALTSPSVEIARVEVIRTRLARVASDHLPLLVEFTIRAA